MDEINQQIQKQLGTLNKTTGEFDLDETDQLLLKSIKDQGIKNPVTGELYQKGDYIYVIRTEKSRVTPKPTSDGSTDQYADFLRMSDDNLIAALVNPLSVTGRGTYIVRANGDLVRNTGGDDSTKFPVVWKKGGSSNLFRDILRNASAQERNK